MLDELHVCNYALVRDVNLVFSSGLTVLSGETGAGKTALVGAIKLLIGERADVMSIRDGASELLVEGRMLVDGEECVISRKLNKEGRSRCTINNSMVTVGNLSEQIGPLIELHGQHEHQSLLSTGVQLDYLDQYAGEVGAQALASYQQAFMACTLAQRAVEELSQSSRVSAQAQDVARHTLREIEAVSPAPGEYQEIEQQLPILRNGESLALASQTALELLRNEGGALEQMAKAHRMLEQQGGVDTRLDELAAQMQSVSVVAEDVATSLRAYRESIEFNPHALEQALSRLSALEGLCKRYGPRIEDVFVAWEQAQELLGAGDNLSERVATAQQELVHAEERLVAAARALVTVRAAAAKEFSAELSAALTYLAMQGASVEYAILEMPRETWTERGSAKYELLYKPSPVNQPRPLANVASGGELSRVMLALKTLFHTKKRQQTLVFDEVDAGIGGNTATAIAQRIRLLANSHQVIVVTHLAQIAAVANKQLVVEKSLHEGVATTSIYEVSGEKRVLEIARMLSGRDDQAALEHARGLLESGRALCR